MLDYLDVLAELHATRQPRVYLEIGVSRGESLRQVGRGTICIGVDPEPKVPEDLAFRCHIERTTSDHFFAGRRLSELVGDGTLDLTFIDGLHLFEFALRDFMNAEEHSRTDSVIILHDCLPRDAETSSRERTTVHWTGDVWKLVLCLLEYRQDLEFSLIDVPPSGLLLITRLRPGDRKLRENYAAIVEQFVPLGFEEWQRRKAEVMHRLANTAEAKIWAGKREVAVARAQAAQSDARIAELERQLRDIHDSASWRITAPARRLGQVLEQGRKLVVRP